MRREKNQNAPNGHAGTQPRTNGSVGQHRTGPNGAAKAPSEKKNKKGKKKGQQEKSQRLFHLTGSTDFAAMQDGAAYVNAVASRVDLVGASVLLVKSNDEKVAKSELDRLREMKFGKGPVTVVEEITSVEVGDLPRPAR